MTETEALFWDSSLGLAVCLDPSPASSMQRFLWPIFGPGFDGPGGYEQTCDVFSHTRQFGNCRSLGKTVSLLFSLGGF